MPINTIIAKKGWISRWLKVSPFFKSTVASLMNLDAKILLYHIDNFANTHQLSSCSISNDSIIQLNLRGNSPRYIFIVNIKWYIDSLYAIMKLYFIRVTFHIHWKKMFTYSCLLTLKHCADILSYSLIKSPKIESYESI